MDWTISCIELRCTRPSSFSFLFEQHFREELRTHLVETFQSALSGQGKPVSAAESIRVWPVRQDGDGTLMVPVQGLAETFTALGEHSFFDAAGSALSTITSMPLLRISSRTDNDAMRKALLNSFAADFLTVDGEYSNRYVVSTIGITNTTSPMPKAHDPRPTGEIFF